jgi:hypothetical protein
MFSWLKTKSGAPDARTVLERTIILRELFVKGLVTSPLDVLVQSMEGWGEAERQAFNEDCKKQFSDRIPRLREIGVLGKDDCRRTQVPERRAFGNRPAGYGRRKLAN